MSDINDTKEGAELLPAYFLIVLLQKTKSKLPAITLGIHKMYNTNKSLFHQW